MDKKPMILLLNLKMDICGEWNVFSKNTKLQKIKNTSTFDYREPLYFI